MNSWRIFPLKKVPVSEIDNSIVLRIDAFTKYMQLGVAPYTTLHPNEPGFEAL